MFTTKIGRLNKTFLKVKRGRCEEIDEEKLKKMRSQPKQKQKSPKKRQKKHKTKN